MPSEMAKPTHREVTKPDAPAALVVVPTKAAITKSLLFGVGPAELVGDTRRYLAYRVENGVTTVLTPRRHNADWGESLASAVARVSEAMAVELPRYARTK